MPTPIDPRLPPQDQAMQQARHSLVVYRRIATLFLLLTAVVVGLVLYVVFSRANVVVLSKQENVESDFIIDIARDPAPNEVKGDVLEETESATATFPATSGAMIDDHAKGTVRISSTMSHSQVLVATTRLLTPENVLYRISETVTVPANGSVEVEAYADVAGKAGETEKASFTIPGLNPSSRELFTVETVTPFIGGVRTARSVTQEDMDKALATLKQQLSTSLEAKLDAQAQEKALATSGRAIQVDVISQKSSAEVGAEVAEFTLTVDVRATGLYFDETQFAKQVEARLRDLIGFDQTLLAVTEDSAAREVEKRDLVSGRANMRVKARGIAILSKDAPALDTEKLAGISVDAARAYVESIEGVASASVSTSPFWSNRMPARADHITVEVR